MVTVTTYVRLDILIYNSLFLGSKNGFKNSASFEVTLPNRANFGQKSAFTAILLKGSELAIPMNAPVLINETPRSYNLGFVS